MLHRLLLVLCFGCASVSVAPNADVADRRSSETGAEEAATDGIDEAGNGDTHESDEDAGEAEPREPVDDPVAALMSGVEAGEAGKWGEAMDLFRAVLAVTPTWAAAHLEMANALLMTGGPPGAIAQHIQQARLLGRENARIYYLEGLLMEEQREPAMAAAAYEQAVELRPSLLDARMRLGRLLLEEEHVDDAIVHLEAAVRLDPTYLPARANLALAYEAADRIDDAAGQLQAVADVFPDNPFHLHRLAELYERHGRAAEAEEARERAEGAQPSERPRMRPLLPSRR